MKADWITNQYHGYSFRVGDTTYATVYPNEFRTYDIYLTGTRFNPVELPSARKLTEAQDTAARAVFAHLVAAASAVEEGLGEA